MHKDQENTNKKVQGNGEEEHPEKDAGGTPVDDEPQHTIHLSGMYQDWFLDYASYVILERAVPHINDGLKPVQRRILHTMRRMEDGSYNKVANIIGYTMQYHPHGDASIQDALVQLGQKGLLIDTQGNWGNISTGDSAAAPRYIEARLTKFAQDVVFNPKTTEWKPSYDGRNKEPITLPVKFPLLLAQGVEGIAVGLASKILPHNFNELIDAAIAYLKEKDFTLYPDFPGGGMIDVSKYNDGHRGGSVRVRARITKQDKNQLAINELPYGKTTISLIDSIVKANDKGKIKIKKIDDNTAENVEIIVHVASGASLDKTIDALYAFTDCEVSISPNACVIDDDKPRFMGVSEILKINTEQTVALLKQELEIRKNELEEAWHMSSLEKIFIENKIYNNIEDCETWEAIIETIDKGLEPFKKKLIREISRDDIVKLTEIKIKRISKYDVKKADEYIKDIEGEIENVKNKLDNLIAYTIDYFQNIKKKYGKGKERQTEIRSFDTIEATKVAANNVKLFVNRKEGFIGTDLKKDEFLCECSDIDDIIVFLKNGKYIITKVDSKSFVGKNILHARIFKRNDERTIYNVIYRDGYKGNIMMKRCAISSITRDREYDITKGNEGSEVLYFSANPNGEAEILTITLKPRPRLKNRIFDMDFAGLAIKGKNSMGNILTKYPIHKIKLKEKGESTLGGKKIWYDPEVMRINIQEKGDYIGEFHDGDKILVVTKDGQYRLSSFDLTNHFEENIIIIEKFDKNKTYTCIYYDGEKKYHYIKRFSFDPVEIKTPFIGEHPKSKLVHISDEKYPQFEINISGHSKKDKELIDADEFIGVKGIKARGKRLTSYKVKKVVEKEPLEKEETAEQTPTEQNNNAQAEEQTSNDQEIELEIKPKESKQEEKKPDVDKSNDNKKTDEENIKRDPGQMTFEWDLSDE